MSEFLYIYRMTPAVEKPSPEEMQQRMQKWMTWMNDLGALSSFTTNCWSGSHRPLWH